MVEALPLAATDPLIVAVVGALLGGGVLSGIAVLMRAPRQGQLDVLNASKIIYDELRAELFDVRRENEKLNEEHSGCALSVQTLEGRLAATEAENAFLRERITYVEDQIRRRQAIALGQGEAEARRVAQENLPDVIRRPHKPHPDVSSD